MPFPAEILRRTVTVGGETALESGESLILQASIKASRGLIWRATGWHYQTVEKVYTSDEGAELTFPLVCTDLAGPWGLDDDSGTVLDMSAPGSYSHRYTIKVVVLKSVDGRLSKVGERTYNNVTVPTGDLSPFDLDAMLPVSTQAGGIVLVPDTWDQRVVAAEAAATAAIAEATDAKIAVWASTERSSDVDVDEAIAAISQSVVGITTYAGAPNAICHPSVVFVADGWQGWRYWMAYTPFNGESVRLENPCIAVSNDGDTWTVPAGLTNPVEPDPGVEVGYNADPVLCLSKDGSTMLLVWKRSAATKQTCLRTSTDGVTWTPRQVLFENAYEDVSPALLWDGFQYRMWTIRHDTNPNTLWVRTADAPEGPWSAPVACTATIPSGADLWHIDIARVGQQYHAVMTSADEWTPTGNQHWFGKSNDGLSWVFGREALMRTMSNPQNAFYKACLLPKITGDGLKYDMWYSSRQDFALRKTEVSFVRSRRLRDINTQILSAMSGLSPSVFGDNFDRADTTAGIGTATSGHAWSSVMGNVMGIQSGQVYLPVAANSRSIVELGVSDFRVGVSFKVLGGTSYMMFRYVDASNLWRVGHSSGAMILQKIVGGALTTITPNAATVRAGDRVEVRCVGSDIRVYINGLGVLHVTDGALASGTRVGLNMDNTVARFDNMAAYV